MLRRRSADGEGGSSRSSMRWRLQALLGERRRSVVALSASSVLSGFMEAAILTAIAQIATSIVNGTTRVHIDAGPLHRQVTVGALFAVALGCVLVRLALQAPISILPARIAADVQAQLRRSLFDAFTRASWSVQSSDREGHLQETMTSQVIQATQGALQATMLITALLSFLVLMLSALAVNVAAAAVVLGAATLLFGLLRPLNLLGTRRARALSQAQMEYAGGVGEAIRLAEETHVFGVAAAQRARVERLIGDSREMFYRTQLIGRLVPNIYQSLLYLILVLALAGLYAQGSHHVASLGAVVFLLVRAGSYGQQVQACYQGLRQSLPFVERLQESRRRYETSAVSDGGRPLATVRTLRFEHACFAYRPSRPVLSDVSFEVLAGEAVGIVGPSGAGKSSLVQVLLQLRAPSGGRYLVNDAPAELFSRADWHRRVAYVPQEPRLLHASVAENIRYFRDIDDGAVQRAARLARIHEDILGFSHGYETIVGPRADAVSGGQQQRICLARALAAEPQVLVLDEPTSALDPRSEALIRDSLVALAGRVTLFIVAHRMSTLDMCARVMVIVDGRLDAFEPVAALQERNSYYRAATLTAGTTLA
jgi:ATP-binding cassette, subfamily B, bacterial